VLANSDDETYIKTLFKYRFIVERKTKSGMMNRIRTTRPLQLLMLVAGFLVCSGYSGVMGICLDCDFGSHFAPMDAGCYHCADSGNPGDGPATGGAGYHNHCTKLGVPSDFLIGGQPRSSGKDDTAPQVRCLLPDSRSSESIRLTNQLPHFITYPECFSSRRLAALATIVLIC
jgi:hypothetical protein